MASDQEQRPEFSGLSLSMPPFPLSHMHVTCDPGARGDLLSHTDLWSQACLSASPGLCLLLERKPHPASQGHDIRASRASKPGSRSPG